VTRPVAQVTPLAAVHAMEKAAKAWGRGRRSIGPALGPDSLLGATLEQLGLAGLVPPGAFPSIVDAIERAPGLADVLPRGTRLVLAFAEHRTWGFIVRQVRRYATELAATLAPRVA
jgi:hypothetical protein